MQQLDSALLNAHARVPVNVAFTATGVDVNACDVYKSKTSPIRVALRGWGGIGFSVINKVSCAGNDYANVTIQIGDDIRQDSLVLQLIRLMNEIWLEDALDLRMIVFRCLPTGDKRGISLFNLGHPPLCA